MTRSGLGSHLLDGPFVATDEDLKAFAGCLNGLTLALLFWIPLILILIFL